MLSPEKPEDPLSQFSLSIFRLNGLLTQCGDSVTKAIGQSSARWQVLGRAAHERRSVAQMARDLGHARQSVQRVADLLVAEGLAVYRDDTADKRSQLLQLTARGVATLKAIYGRYGKWSKRVMSVLDGAQLSSLAAALNAIADLLESNDAAGPDFINRKTRTR